MLRFLVFISILFIHSQSSAQQTIKIRKASQLHGFYQLQTENKEKEFLYFDTESNVALVSSQKRRKAKGNLYACINDNNCQTALKATYKLDGLEISFSFNRGKGDAIYFVEFEGTLSPDALYLTLKKGETGKLIEVKEFRRLKD